MINITTIATSANTPTIDEIVYTINSLANQINFVFFFVCIGFAVLCWIAYNQNKLLKEAIAIIATADPKMTKKIAEVIKAKEDNKNV